MHATRFNFEVPNFFSLKDRAGRVHYYVTMGAEGGSIPGHPRWALWSEGQVSRRQNGSAEFSVLSSGVADWGNLYALTAFEDTKHDRRVQWGWSDEGWFFPPLLRVPMPPGKTPNRWQK